MTSNRRAFTRVSIALQASVSFDPGATLTGSTQDLSATGFLFAGDPDLTAPPAGTTGQAVLSLAPEHGVLEPITLDVTLVADRGAGHLACEITAVHGADAFNDLRQFVLYNAEDPAQADREFSEHSGIRPAPPSDD